MNPSDADRIFDKHLSTESIESFSPQRKLPPRQLSLKTLGKGSISRNSSSS